MGQIGACAPSVEHARTVSISFLADADLNRAIVTGVQRREPALDFLTSNEAGIEGQGDPDVLEFAASEGDFFWASLA